MAGFLLKCGGIGYAEELIFLVKSHHEDTQDTKIFRFFWIYRGGDTVT